MTDLTVVITDAGRQAANDAESQGFQVTISEVAIGTGNSEPSVTRTELVNELKRLDAQSASDSEPTIAHMFVIDESTDSYTVKEVGFYLDDGTLFAYYSDADGDVSIASKTEHSKWLAAFDIVLDSIPADSVTVSPGTGFQLPSATPSTKGIVELADQSEMDDESDSSRVPPVDVVAQYVNEKISAIPEDPSASTSQAGHVELATQSEMNTGSDSTRVPPVDVIAQYVNDQNFSYSRRPLGLDQPSWPCRTRHTIRNECGFRLNSRAASKRGCHVCGVRN